MSAYPLAPTATPVAAEPQLSRAVSYVAARSWWMLKTHVAEANGLPRSSAGPEPKPPAGR